MKRPLKTLAAWLFLSFAHLVLFAVGSRLFAPVVPGAQSPSSTALLGLGAMALTDSALLLFYVRTSRLHGWRLMLTVSPIFYFVKTVTSQIEAVYFMPNVSGPMLPGLLLMTLPLALVLPVLAVLVGGRLRAGPLDESPPWWPLPSSQGEALGKTAFLSAVVYPLLFFAAGWFIAFRSPELRDFYGGAHGDDVVSHYRWVFQHDPFIYPLEVLRGLLWVAAAVPLLRAAKGQWWLGTLHVALWFALVQNDVHWLPNPLMTPSIRLHHFVETASSNFVWAWCIGWVLSHPLPKLHLGRALLRHHSRP